MPTFPVGVLPATVKSYSASFIDTNGDQASISLSPADTVLDAELDAVTSAVAGVTNAGLVASVKSTKIGIAPKKARAFDEANNSVTEKAELVFQDNALVTRSVSIPAPDAQYLSAGTVLNTGNMASAISAIELVLNGGVGGSGTFSFSRGYKVSRSRSTNRPNVIPTIEEPGLLDAPSQSPATE